MKYLGTIRQKLRRQIVITPSPRLVHKTFFPSRNLLKHNGSLAKFFRSCELKNFSTKPSSFLFLCLKLFDTRILSKHRRVLLRILSALRDKDFSTEFSDISFLCINFSDARNFLKHRSVPRRIFLALWDETFSTENSDTLLHKVQKSVVELMFVRTLWKLLSKR